MSEPETTLISSNEIALNIAELPEDLLVSEISSLIESKKKLTKEFNDLRTDHDYWKFKYQAMVHRLMGKKAEKVYALESQQSLLFDEAEALDKVEPKTPETVEVKGYTKAARGKRLPLPAELPRVEEIIDLPNSEKICAKDGSTLQVVSRESSERLDIIPEKIQVIVTTRLVYGCKCCPGLIKTAPTPARIIPKSNVSEGLLAHLIVSKYCDHLPLYRLEDRFARLGVDLSRTTLARWIVQAGEALQPLVNLLEDRAIGTSYLQMDETRVQVLNEKLKPVDSDKFIWVRRALYPDHEIILYDYDPTRKSEVAKRLLESYQGYVQVDGYSGYHWLESASGIKRVGCMAHVRRKFFEVVKHEKSSLKATQIAHRILALIKKLYQLESDMKPKSPEDRKEQRTLHSLPIFKELEQLVTDSKPKVPTRSGLGKALEYADSQLKFIAEIFNNGKLEIDSKSSTFPVLRKIS